jgi:branched-chain amino acid transport system ATP-binding protein
MLTVRDVVGGYGSGAVLQGISIDVGVGATAILGRNGAGKTTLAKTIMGLLKPTAGRIHWDDDEITGMSADRIFRHQVAYVPQERPVFMDLTVQENLRLAADLARSRARSVDDVLDVFPILRDRLAQRAGTLSGGQRKFLGVARAVISSPRLIILDEPSEGVWPAVVEEMGVLLTELKSDVSVLLIEQHLHMALTVADQVYVVERGTVSLEGPSKQIADDPRLYAALVA